MYLIFLENLSLIIFLFFYNFFLFFLVHSKKDNRAGWDRLAHNKIHMHTWGKKLKKVSDSYKNSLIFIFSKNLSFVIPLISPIFLFCLVHSKKISFWTSRKKLRIKFFKSATTASKSSTPFATLSAAGGCDLAVTTRHVCVLPGRSTVSWCPCSALATSHWRLADEYTVHVWGVPCFTQAKLGQWQRPTSSASNATTAPWSGRCAASGQRIQQQSGQRRS